MTSMATESRHTADGLRPRLIPRYTDEEVGVDRQRLIAAVQPGAEPVTPEPRTAQIRSWTAGRIGSSADETAALRKFNSGEDVGPSVKFATVSCGRRGFDQASEWWISERERAC